MISDTWLYLAILLKLVSAGEIPGQLRRSGLALSQFENHVSNQPTKLKY